MPNCKVTFLHHKTINSITNSETTNASFKYCNQAAMKNNTLDTMLLLNLTERLRNLITCNMGLAFKSILKHHKTSAPECHQLTLEMLTHTINT